MIALAAISMAALSCVPEDVPENGQEGGDDAIVSSLVEISVTAEISSDFAAGLWTPKDEISILGEKSGNRKFTAKSSGNPADFTGVADPSDQIMYAVYPYDSAVTVAKGTEKQKGSSGCGTSCCSRDLRRLQEKYETRCMYRRTGTIPHLR